MGFSDFPGVQTGHIGTTYTMQQIIYSVLHNITVVIKHWLVYFRLFQSFNYLSVINNESFIVYLFVRLFAQNLKITISLETRDTLQMTSHK